MRGAVSFIFTVVVIVLLACVVNWMFITDFIIFDILLLFGVIVLGGVIILAIIGIIIWFILEIFS
jgi:hypothetical protein